MTSLLLGCATKDFRPAQLEVYCPQIETYTPAFNSTLVEQISQLPEDFTAIDQVIGDYISLRDTLRKCYQEREKIHANSN